MVALTWAIKTNETFLDTWAVQVVVERELTSSVPGTFAHPRGATPAHTSSKYRQGSQSNRMGNRITLCSSTLRVFWPTYTTASPRHVDKPQVAVWWIAGSLGLVSLIARKGFDVCPISLFSETGQICFFWRWIHCWSRARWDVCSEIFQNTLKFWRNCLTKCMKLLEWCEWLTEKLLSLTDSGKWSWRYTIEIMKEITKYYRKQRRIFV